MKFLFPPVSIIGGLIAGQSSEKDLRPIWGLIDDQEPPESEHRDDTVGKMLLAAAIQGAIFRGVRKAVDHQARTGFASASPAPGRARNARAG